MAEKPKRAIDHPILAKVAMIHSDYVEGLDPDMYPTDRQKFLDKVWEETKVCQACSLCESRTTVVKPDGDASASIMIVGEGPGFLENLSGEVFVGPMELRASRCNFCKRSAKCYESRIIKDLDNHRYRRAGKVVCNPVPIATPTLDKEFYLKSAGAIFDGILIKKWKFAFPRKNWLTQYNNTNPALPLTNTSPFYITNILHCRSFDPITLKDVPPGSISKNQCRKWLAMEWAAVQPKITIALGIPALSVLVGSKTKAEAISTGEIVQTKFGPVIFSHHPAYWMREKQQEVKAYGFAKVADVIEKALIVSGQLPEKVI